MPDIGEQIAAERGTKIDHEWYAAEFRKALKAARITECVRPFHDLRHASLTNGVVASEQPLELMARAGHRGMSTTRPANTCVSSGSRSRRRRRRRSSTF